MHLHQWNRPALEKFRSAATQLNPTMRFYSEPYFWPQTTVSSLLTVKHPRIALKASCSEVDAAWTAR